MGEKKIIESQPSLISSTNEVLKNYTAGTPTIDNIKWTHLKPIQIAHKLSEKQIIISTYTIKLILLNLGLKNRKHSKSNAIGSVEGRNEQFEYIFSLQDKFLAAGLPVLSVDTKNKELLGNFYRNGLSYCAQARKVNDHDFITMADGKIVPHGIYDLADNKGYLTLGLSADTASFVCDNLEKVWINHLQWKYPQADTMLLLCDSGGSNNCRHYVFKEAIYRLTQSLQINIVVAHYPTYCSKYNPIEHRFFPHLSRAWSGAVFENIQIVKELAENTSTKTGLQIQVSINNKVYPTGKKANIEFILKVDRYVTFNENRPKWNYMVKYKN